MNRYALLDKFACVFFVVFIGVWSIVAGCGNENRMMIQGNDYTRQAERDRMVDNQIVGGGITDQAVIAAMRRVPRHRFVPDTAAEEAYGDFPLSIGYRQTISQPFIVAYMTQALDLKPDEKVLEIGTGSGYQAAILAELVSKVVTIEIVEPLAARAKETLADLGYDNVSVRAGDGYQGWPDESPFDAIILTAAPKQIPSPLLEQLRIGGRLIVPVGDHPQQLMLMRRTGEGYTQTKLLPVVFVPMTGQALRGPHPPEP